MVRATFESSFHSHSQSSPQLSVSSSAPGGKDVHAPGHAGQVGGGEQTVDGQGVGEQTVDGHGDADVGGGGGSATVQSR